MYQSCIGILLFILIILILFKCVSGSSSGSCYRQSYVENFGMIPKLTQKIQPTIDDSVVYSVPSNYQARVTPRFSNVAYGGNIRYNFPDYKNLAAPLNPMEFNKMTVADPSPQRRADDTNSNMASSSYSTGCGVQNIRYPVKENYSEKGSCNANTQNISFMNEETNMQDLKQPIVYDRFIYANQRSRLNGLGDPIRGDLPIIPMKSDWFRPSVQPHIDLRQGAMAVMGGIDNSTANETKVLQRASANGFINTGNVQTGTARNVNLGYGSDVDVSVYGQGL